MPRPTLARIDLDALRHNYRLASQRVEPGRAMAVVKADGYGHGLAAVATALKQDAPCFAVACLEEALVIRQAGLSQPVVMLEGVHAPEDLVICANQGFEPVLHHARQIEWALASDARPVLWLKLNTGMNRLGFPPAELPAWMSQLDQAGLTVRGLMTHFACADDLESAFTRDQTRVMEVAAGAYPDLLLSLGNSAAHFRPGQALFHWSRPGIMLYGGTPMLEASGMGLGLQPVMSLESELISVRTLERGMSVGYGATWVADKTTPMGVVAIGYGDGYPRHAGTGTPAAVNGVRVRLIGRVSMDMLAVDLTAVPDARAGDPVELWGRQIGVDEVAEAAVNGVRVRLIGRVSMDMLAVDLTAVPDARAGDPVELWGRQVSVDEVAEAAGTIAYELLTGVTPRVPRQYSE